MSLVEQNIGSEKDSLGAKQIKSVVAYLREIGDDEAADRLQPARSTGGDVTGRRNRRP